MNNNVVVFDLDDTLYKEIDYASSAFKAIADFIGIPDALPFMLQWRAENRNVFMELNNQFGLKIPIEEYLAIYRNHKPNIRLSNDVDFILRELYSAGTILGIVTDGRVLSQRNKIEALGLYRYFHLDNILISEETGFSKPSEENFVFFMKTYPQCSYYYVGDNIEKDFIAPNILGWKTVMLEDDGRNIHKCPTNVPLNYLPMYRISSFDELKSIIE